MLIPFILKCITSVLSLVCPYVRAHFSALILDIVSLSVCQTVSPFPLENFTDIFSLQELSLLHWFKPGCTINVVAKVCGILLRTLYN